MKRILLGIYHNFDKKSKTRNLVGKACKSAEFCWKINQQHTINNLMAMVQYKGHKTGYHLKRGTSNICYLLS